MKKTLPPSEWLAVATFIGLLLFVGVVTHLNRPTIYYVDPADRAQPRHELAIEILGHVRKPGRYYVEKGTPLGEALALAHPYRDADLRRIKRSQPLNKPKTIRIKQRQTITITVEGAVENPGTLTLLKGARLCDLADHLTLLDNANPRSLQSKRILKNKEEIYIKSRR